MFTRILAFARVRPVVATCVGLTLVLGVANVFLWRAREAIALRHESVREKGELMLRVLKNRPRIDADLAALREGVTQIEDSLLDEASMEVNLGYFYRLEKNSRVRLVRLNQLASTPAPKGSPFKAVPFSMQVTGSYRNDMLFLRALESGTRILRVRNCSFERPAAGGSDFVLELIIDVIAKSDS